MDEPFEGSFFGSSSIKHLRKCFRKIDSDNSGTLSFQELMSIPELKENLLAKRIIDILDKNKTGQVTFQQFVQGISKFSPAEEKITKLKFLYRVYDVDNEGGISNAELFQVLKMFILNITDVGLQQIVDKTFVSLNKDRDDRISFDEFCKIITVNSINYCEAMTVDI